MNAPLRTLGRDVDRLAGVHAARVAMVEGLTTTVTQLEGQVGLLSLTDLALTALLQQTSQENLRAIEALVTSGLAAIFDDLSLRFEFQVDTVRGQQSLTPLLVSPSGTAPILDAHGGGPASVVAVLLRILTVHRLQLAPLIVLDEALLMVSRQYVPATAAFLVGLCERLGLQILLVTHEPSFCEGATRTYEIVSSPQGASFRRRP